MKLLIALVVVSAVSVNAGEDWKMFMKWAKTKAFESCWGEENMKIYTLEMKKAVSKCLQVDAPETELPPLRYLNRFTNNLVNMANNNNYRHDNSHDENHQHGDDFEKMMKMMIMVKMMNTFGENENHNVERHGCNGFHDCDDQKMMMRRMMMKMINSHEGHDRMDNMDRMDSMDMFSKMFRSMKSNYYDSYKNEDHSPMMKRFMVMLKTIIFFQFHFLLGRIPEKTG